MTEWDEFSAFPHVFDLEHVCDRLAENAAVDPECSIAESLCGESSCLVERLNSQAVATKQMIDSVRAGLYDRTWIASLFGALFCELDEVAEKPYLLPSYLPGILLNLHKVLIAAHDVFDPVHRARLVAAAEAAGVQEGLKITTKKALSQHMSAVAKKPRNRGHSKTGGLALVAQVRAESKKRLWNTAWSWLCNQAENHASVGEFQLDGTTSEGGTVSYFSDSDSASRSIKKKTFQDYWVRPNRTKKAGS